MKKLFSFEDGEGDITLSKHKCKWPDQDIYVLTKVEDNESIAFTWIELLILKKYIQELYTSQIPPLSPYSMEQPITDKLRVTKWGNNG